MTLHAIQYQPTREDIKREHRMRELLDLIQHASNKRSKGIWWAEYQKLHKERSPEFVRNMEQKLGLTVRKKREHQ